MAKINVSCLRCGHEETVFHGKSSVGEQRYRCKSSDCGKTFQLSHRYNAYKEGIKDQIVDMAVNGSGIRDTARVLSVAINTVITTIKKSL